MAGYPGGFGGRSPSASPYGGQPPPQPGKTLRQLTRSPHKGLSLVFSQTFIPKLTKKRERARGLPRCRCLSGYNYRTVFWMCSSLLLFTQCRESSVSRCLTDVMSQSSSFVCSRNVLFSSFGHWWLVPKGSTVTLEQEITSNPWVFWWAARNASGYERTEWAVDNLHIAFIVGSKNEPTVLFLFPNLQQDWDIIERTVLR